ncbi:Glyoxalase-like domain protein [Piscirickettsia salmonis]|uniref:VOC family protein n=1 Tax=Piscirickettsia salmonis TaxID=1238 RepID=UPI0012B80554|nr:VOC family protein [Piscirickettsia salmonis]QGP51006.1 Glyoxalase-like domain protein [Piscirickettsia salmonis]
MFKYIDHLALHVSDAEKSKDFYCQHFDFKPHFFETLASGINIHYLTLENTILELTELPKQTISGMHFCLMTDTFTVSFNQLKVQGLTINQTPHPTSARTTNEKNWQRAVFLGPDQEHIEIRGPN